MRVLKQHVGGVSPASELRHRHSARATRSLAMRRRCSDEGPVADAASVGGVFYDKRCTWAMGDADWRDLDAELNKMRKYWCADVTPGAAARAARAERAGAVSCASTTLEQAYACSLAGTAAAVVQPGGGGAVADEGVPPPHVPFARMDKAGGVLEEASTSLGRLTYTTSRHVDGHGGPGARDAAYPPRRRHRQRQLWLNHDTGWWFNYAFPVMYAGELSTFRLNGAGDCARALGVTELWASVALRRRLLRADAGARRGEARADRKHKILALNAVLVQDAARRPARRQHGRHAAALPGSKGFQVVSEPVATTIQKCSVVKQM